MFLKTKTKKKKNRKREQTNKEQTKTKPKHYISHEALLFGKSFYFRSCWWSNNSHGGARYNAVLVSEFFSGEKCAEE